MSQEVRSFANTGLGDLYLEFLYTIRTKLYQDIAETREALAFEDGELRQDLVAGIREVGEAIEQARATLAPYHVVQTLINTVQGLNMARHDNRERVKQLAFEQSVNKAQLSEVSREISRVEDYFAFGLEQLGSPFATFMLVEDFDDGGPYNGVVRFEEEE